MVKLQEVEDEHFAHEQTGPKLEENEEDYFTDTDSEISSDDEPEVSLEESLADRISALKDMIPPKHRAIVTNAFSTTSWWVKRGLSVSGKTLWVVSTSALLLGVPWALAFAEEQQMIEMEKEVRMQQSANEVLTPGATNQLNQQLGQAPARPAL